MSPHQLVSGMGMQANYIMPFVYVMPYKPVVCLYIYIFLQDSYICPNALNYSTLLTVKTGRMSIQYE